MFADRDEIEHFVRESNAIEGIHRDPTDAEIDATALFVGRHGSSPVPPSVDEVEKLVAVYQPDAILRRKPGLNVRVGNHIAPDGGPTIVFALAELLDGLFSSDPWETHCRYETLHPFTDGNGRSGRAIWAWQMVRRQRGLPLGFLHQFYYQTLAHDERRAA